jgi:hypothetical protein
VCREFGFIDDPKRDKNPSLRFCVPNALILPSAMKTNCRVPSRLRGGRRETKKVITREDGYTYIAALCVFITAGPITKLFAGGGWDP